MTNTKNNRTTGSDTHPSEPGALVLLGLGANLGDPASTLTQACEAIAQENGVEIIRAASLYQSAPVNAPGPHYVNTALLIRTQLAPLTLLKRMQAIEADFGRVRSVRNAPRTLDIDLLWHEHVNLDEPQLILPHPRLHERAFVLKPIAELLDETFVIRDKSVSHWLSLCEDQPCERISTE